MSRFYYQCPECSEEHTITSPDDVPEECENCGFRFRTDEIEQRFDDFVKQQEPPYEECK